MYSIEGNTEYQEEVVTCHQARSRVGSTVTLQGFVQKLRPMGGAVFVVLRDRAGLIQVFVEKSCAGIELLTEGSAIEVRGACRAEERAPGGMEVLAQEVRGVATLKEPLPFTIGKKELGLALDTDLEWRPLSLRHATHYHRFKLQAGILQGYRGFLRQCGFTEICSPKLVAGNAEGGSNIFTLPYFGTTASLAQSPQLYKQMMVPVFTRVFETGHVYRAEQHNSSRHLNEYVSLDLEMGFIKSFEDIMQIEAACLKHILLLLQREYAESLETLKVKVPTIRAVPVLHLREALELLGEPADSEQGALNAAQERQLCALVEERYGSEFVFVTHYHTSERPFLCKGGPVRQR